MVARPSPGEHALNITAAEEKAMHPFPVDPKQIRDPHEDEPAASGPSRSGSSPMPMPMRRRTQAVGRALLALLFVAFIAVVVIALL
jgi:hypothetical protein